MMRPPALRLGARVAGLHRALAVLAVTCGLAAVGGAASAGTYTPPPGDYAPVWSPDRSAIVYFTQRQPPGLRVMNPDGSGERVLPLPAPPDGDPPSFSFSPDWFWIAFASRELVVSRPDGSQRRALGPSNFAARPAWSPDGHRLAFPRGYALFVVGVDGSGLRELTPHGSEPAWSASSELIAFSRTDDTRSDVLVVRADGSGERNLTRNVAGVHRRPVWSPDGRIAFVTTDQRTASTRVTAMAGDGTLLRSFAPGVLPTSLAWSPDGTRLLVSGSALAVVDVTSGERRLLSPFGAEADWSRDGRYIVFAASGECRDRTGIYRVDAVTGRRDRLTNDCRITGTPRSDRLRGTATADILLGLAGNDQLTAVTAAFTGDSLYGGPGDDALTGSRQGDLLDGSSGRDRLRGFAGPDFLRGGPGRDVLLGDGGRDHIRAEDGARDRVSCGTNRSRGTGPELDTAFVDRRDAVDGGCELLYRGGRADLGAGRTALSILVNVGGGDVVRTLRCNPAGGTLLGAAAACRRLAAMRAPLAPVPADRFCAALGNAVGAHVSGTFAGRRVAVDFTRANACEVERWDRHAFLLAAR